MPETTVYELHPLGWENDPEEEKLKLSMLDYFSAQLYDAYALFFKLPDGEQSHTLAILKEGLERTLAQCRHMMGTIEQDDDTHDCFFLKKRDSTVKFVVKYFGPEDGVPSMVEIEKTHYASGVLDVTKLSVEGLLTTEMPEYHPSRKPVAAAFQANFIPGGLIFVTSQHHYTNDLTGWANFARQTRRQLRACVLLHLPLSKAAELKPLATPKDPDAMPKWISTYNAMCALLWRILARHRIPLYNCDPDVEIPLAVETVNMRLRADPPLPARQQRNIFWVAASSAHPNPLTAREVAAQESQVPLSRLAVKIRTMTNGVDQETVLQFLAMTAPVRDKTRLFTRVNSFPPLSFLMTDWRDADLYHTDFGFGRPCAFRHFFGTSKSMKGISLIVVYPPRTSDNPDEGFEFLVAVENDILDAFLVDPDLTSYF
ncbi:hypothetical protein VTJ49DRAFT_7356 [Mycothermus thermophilus]|uniref:Trichothecene 3-O-acetyltransferase-like N-terminal domain-containing protein n=1 Tax=Humicola insolens TaxID=85995 RepID=A0ABR3VI08_HUMIN